MEYKRFRIPNRDVKLTTIEAAVTQTPTFQRLFYLKQLGLAHLVYPCATHTRGGHSIECLDEASKILESVRIKEGDDSWDEVRMAALLHDIGHIPFSHTLEDENEVLPKHDKGERIEHVLEKLKKKVADQKARDLIGKATPILLAISSNDEEKQDWRSDLVGNTVCADLLAYITTDAAWTGIEKRPGYYRIYDYFGKADKKTSKGTAKQRLCIRLTKGGLRTDIVSAILDLLDMRYALTERVIFHHAKAIASAMLGRSARLLKLPDEPSLLGMGDEGLLQYLQNQAERSSDTEGGKGGALLLQHLRSRRLYKRIFKVQQRAMEEWDRSKSNTNADAFCGRWRNGQRVEDLLSKIEDRFDLERGSLVLWCPEGKSGMKLVKANVVWEQSNGWHEPVELRSEEVHRQFPGVYDRVQAIEKQYLDLWAFWIGIHPEQVKKAPAIVSALSSEMEIECDPVFIETYAKTRLPGFAASARLYDNLRGTWQRELMPKASDRLMEIAARPGTEIDGAVITEAIHDVSDTRKTGAKKGQTNKPSGQPELLGEDGQKKERPKK